VDVLLFVGVAVAWAVYLIPKALQQHDQAVRARSVDRFSHTMRVLARREPVSRRSAQLVVPSGRGSSSPVVNPTGASSSAPGASPAEIRARRAAAVAAVKRRRRVLSIVLASLSAVVGVAAFGVMAWWYVAIPVGLLMAWLAACRVMVKGEARAWRRLVDAGPVTERDGGAYDAMSETTEIAVIGDSMRDPAMWDPVAVTLPTYVTKPTATRTVRTIDLDADDVWTSGRTEADAALARQSDAADQAARASREDEQPRAAGSAG
jgi:hypothetical protein